MQLIALNGRAHSGKDTAYTMIDALVREQGGVAERICFADKLKLSGMRALGFDPESTAEAVATADVLKEHGYVTTTWKDEHNNLVKKSVSGREFWQLYGTEAHRDVFGKDFWVDALLPLPPATLLGEPEHNMGYFLSARYPGVDVLVETTTRFPNEAERVLNLGGQVWRIDANVRLGPLPESAHESERGLPPEYITLTVPNNHSLESFEIALRAAWRLACH